MPSVPRTERPPRGASFIWPYSRQGQPAAIVHFGPFAFGAVQYALSSPCRARIGRNERFSCGRLAGNRSLGRFPAGGPLIGANLSQVWRECRALNGHRGVASFIWPHSRHSKRAHHPPVSHYERGRAIRVPARANRSSPLRGDEPETHTHKDRETRNVFAGAAPGRLPRRGVAPGEGNDFHTQGNTGEREVPPTLWRWQQWRQARANWRPPLRESNPEARIHKECEARYVVH